MHNGWTIIPDMTFLLVLPVEEALARRSGHRTEREHFEIADTPYRVQDNYLEWPGQEPSRFIIVDAEKEKKEISKFCCRCHQVGRCTVTITSPTLITSTFAPSYHV